MTTGTLAEAPRWGRGQPVEAVVEDENQMKTVLKTKRQRLSGQSEDDDDPFIEYIDPNIDEGLLELMAGSLDANAKVTVSSYDIRGVRYY